MIRFERVSKRYSNGREAIAGLSFEVLDGELVFLTGRSGAGKSTVLRLTALLERATQGHIWVNGDNLATVRGNDIARFRRRIGIAPQEPRFLPERSVHDNVALPLFARDVPGRQRRLGVRAALERVGLAAAERSRPPELSGAERGRLALARALVGQPSLLLADEPTASLDAALAAQTLELLRALNGQGMTIVVATRNLDLSRAGGGREIALERGDAGMSELGVLPVIAAVR